MTYRNRYRNKRMSKRDCLKWKKPPAKSNVEKKPEDSKPVKKNRAAEKEEIGGVKEVADEEETNGEEEEQKMDKSNP